MNRMHSMGLFLAGAILVAAAPAISAQAYKAPKNNFGQPDINGAWTNSSLTRLERDTKYGDRLVMTPAEVAALESDSVAQVAQGNLPTDPSLSTQQVNQTCDVKGFSGVGCGYNAGFTDPGDVVMRVHGEPRTSFITYPANGRVPAPKAGVVVNTGRVVVAPSEGDDVPAAARGGAGGGRGGGGRGGGGAGAGGAARGGQFDNPENRSLPERCIMSFGQSSGPVMGPQLYNSNYQFVQGKDSVGIWVEMVHDVKIVRLNAKHRTDGIRPYMGDSIGHYEGDTLVVETTNFPQSQALRGSWQNLKVTEKFTRVAPDRLLYQFKVEDPTIWDQAWGGEYEFGRSKGPVFEYACHEGNYALADILAGARADEAAAKGNTAAR